MGMTLTKEFVNNCRNVGVLRDFLCQAIDQVDEKDKEIAELKEQYKDMDVTHTVHIAKMNAKIEELEDNVAFWKKENRRLKRALWIAHAYKAKFKRWWLHLALDYEASMIRPDTKTINRIRGKIGNCEKSERKCRAKAEEYK